MALTLLARVRDKASGALKAVQDYFNPESNGGQNFWSSNAADAFAGAQRTILPIAQKTGQTIQKLPQVSAPSMPETKSPIVNKVLDIANTPQKITSAGLNLGGDIIRDTGKFIETASTPEKLQEVGTGAQQLPNQIKGGDIMGALDNPATQFALAAPILGGTTKVKKTGAKMLIKDAPILIEDAIKTGKITLEEGELLAKELAPVIKNGAKFVDDALKTGKIFQKKGVIKKTAEALFGGIDIGGTRGIISKSGPAGEKIVQLLDIAEKEGASLSGNATVKLQTALNGLKGQELDTFSDVVEGITKPISKKQEEAVKIWEGIANDVRTMAQEAGIDMGTIEKYFPHYSKELNAADKIALAQDLVSSGKFKSEAEAMQAIEKEASSLGRNAPRRFANLELSRESDLKLPYNKSPNVLFDYVKNAYSRVADAKSFGVNDENLYKLARASETQGGDGEQVLQYLDQILGKNQTGSKVADTLTSFQTITKLNPVTSVKNLTQNLSTWLRTDTGTMARTFKNIVADPAKAFENATRVGEISPDMARQLQDYVGEGKGASKWIRLIGMQGTEKFNRVVSVNAGMDYIGKLAKQLSEGSTAALRELERFGIAAKDIKNGVLSEDQLLEAGRKLSRMTQFSTKAGDLPYAWKTNVGKVATQFKSFGYKQTGLLFGKGGEVGRIISEGKNGNFKPLLNALTVYGVAAPIVGEILNDITALFKNNKRKTPLISFQRYAENILGATSFGLFDNVGGLFGQYGESGIVGTVGGPTSSDAYKGVVGVADTAKGIQNYDPEKSLNENLDPANTTKRAIIKEIPAVGGTISNTIVPNSYVDNFIGVNNGLNKADNETYKNMKKVDPTAAEDFKKKNQQADKPKSNLTSSLFGKKEGFDWESKPTSKKGRTEYNSQVDKALESGATLPDSALKNRFFDGQDYESAKSNGDKEKVMESLLKVVNDEYLTPEQKASVAKAAKVDDNSLSYYRLASMTEEDKVASILDFASSTELDHDKFLTALALNKRRVAGKSISTTAMVDRLYDEGLISKSDKAFLTALKFDSIYNKFYMDRDYKGGGMSDSERKSTITKINSIFKAQTTKAPAIKKLDFSGNTTLKNTLPNSADLKFK